MRRLLILWLTLTLSAGAQLPALTASPVDPTAYQRKASETDKPAVFGYMISDFFHQRYRDGALPVWKATGLLFGLDALLVLDLWRRRKWLR